MNTENNTQPAASGQGVDLRVAALALLEGMRQCADALGLSRIESSPAATVAAVRQMMAALAAARAENERLREALTETLETLTAAKDAIVDIRDCVLNERHQLAEAGAGSDVVNATLGIIDDRWPDARVAETITRYSRVEAEAINRAALAPEAAS